MGDCQGNSFFCQMYLSIRLSRISSLLGNGGGMRLLFVLFLLLAPCYGYTKDKKEKKEKKPKQERLVTLQKNARVALKNQSGQDAARNALLGALARPDLKNKHKASIYYTAALLEESINGIENQKAYLKQPYDTAKFFNKLRDMYGQLRLCDSIDLTPDAKGRVHARFQKKTRALRLKHRRNIFGGGKYYLSKRNYAAAYPFFDLYCTYRNPEKADTLYPQAALWASLSSFLVEDYAGTIKHVDSAIVHYDSVTAAILQEYKVRSYGKLKNDSAWVAGLQLGVVKYPYHDYFFVQLADWCYAHRAYAVERKLADRVISETGGKAIHYYAKSKCYLAEENYEACIACADSTIRLDDEFVDAYYNKGIAYLNMAVLSQESSSKDTHDPQYAIDKEKTQELFRQARPCMEMVRKLQPENTERWAPPLYRIYLYLNLGDEFMEIDGLLNKEK